MNLYSIQFKAQISYRRGLLQFYLFIYFPPVPVWDFVRGSEDANLPLAHG